MRELSCKEIEHVNGAGIIGDALWKAVYAVVDLPSRTAGKVVGDKIGGTIGGIIAVPVNWIYSLFNKK
ncbi:hypothetical protein [Pragia fontium]|uniref:Uncharacterized protein n=2 Tax=Pragia fontium TaxID=82985 RepID=A0AAJ5BH24_9GAMM|nr:hypothetical protein [Pragia fontium]AKJ42465.1 hypothetical protein QQ39_10515 [Pragia fontium]SFC76212.1 hypothetical protein SAMN02745723_10458 [Pragia fontium DSM 5563 = ATCC 49100]SUB82764.1 Uncharacterised protein [Pragia fontium]VEJ55670.1 Uncharacterised protein [Pragia fontium]GKX62725.1 hypothetical protein SOASR032_12940 [Pragia fontium]